MEEEEASSFILSLPPSEGSEEKLFTHTHTERERERERESARETPPQVVGMGTWKRGALQAAVAT